MQVHAENPAACRVARLLLAAAFISLCPGCAGVQYLAQSVSGQMEVLAHRRPISEVLDDPATPESVKRSLHAVQEIVAFAHENLLLPDNGSYRSYADLGRPHVAWNVFAAPALSLEPLRWCFPVAGCLSYRGYFDRAEAESFATRLRTQGHDVHVAPVAGYSTLGWFRDPVLHSMLRRSEPELARLLFHELAHQKLYLGGDTELNEAFADAVALIGVERWQRRFPDRVEQRFRRELEVETAFVELVLAYRELLRGTYDSTAADAVKHVRKRALFEALRTDYAMMKRRLTDPGTYDEWFDDGPNNARMAAMSTYRELVPLFINVYRSTDSNIELFYAQIHSLEPCDRNARVHLLRQALLPADC